MLRRTKRLTRGFTLLELLVVIAILALIAAFAAPELFSRLGSAKHESAKIEITNLSQVIDIYRLEVGSCPPSLSALVEKPAGEDNWNGPYLKKPVVPQDPWGRDFHYRCPGEHGDFDLCSLGADNATGGDGEDRDVSSWK